MMAGERSYAKLGATRTSLQQAANDRLLDAEALLQAGRFASAIAEGLYALEITLKVESKNRPDAAAVYTKYTAALSRKGPGLLSRSEPPWGIGCGG